MPPWRDLKNPVSLPARVNKSLDASDQPFATTIAINYTIPAVEKYRWLRSVTGGWTIGTVLRYARCLPILVPYSNNNLNAIMLALNESCPSLD